MPLWKVFRNSLYLHVHSYFKKKETAIPALIQQLNKIPTVHHSRLQPTTKDRPQNSFRLSGRAHRSREVRRARQALGPPRDHPAVRHIRRICRGRGEAGGPRQALRRHDGHNDWSGGGGGCREVGRQGQEVTPLEICLFLLLTGLFCNILCVMSFCLDLN